MIPEEHKQHVKTELNEKLTNKVKVIVFTQQNECAMCKETRELVEEVGRLSDKIGVETYDFEKDKEQATLYKVDRVPAIVFLGEKDYEICKNAENFPLCARIHYYGLPFGYEFQTFMEDLVVASTGNSGLLEETKAKLRTIDKPVHIQVFVTLTCPYCPTIASMTHKFALESSLITADVIDANEFPQMGIKYNVLGVPKTVVNEKVEFVGVVSENVLLDRVFEALKAQT
ncbi:MAG TPA: thioredoxin family protein [Candidatus Bathyarchaeia archaeon]|nr:thioredoxin family protein [Candidatus Bathyarchaeia archaeon]